MSAAGRVHVVGAGLAGLAAAVALAVQGRPVTLYDAGRHAGGRCRSYFDSELGCRIDNGNHLLLSGNRSAFDYLALIGGLETLDGPLPAAFPFIDLLDGARWTLRPNAGRLPFWIFRAARRAPGTRPVDYLKPAALSWAGPTATVCDVLDRHSVAFRRLWEPLVVAALNTQPEQASANLFWHILFETLGRGGQACRPLLPKEGLSESFVDPALAMLDRRGASVRLGTRLRRIEFVEQRVAALDFDDGRVLFGADEIVVMAVPAPIAARLVPGLMVPDRHSPIVNAHFRYDGPVAGPDFIGVVGGTSEWVFKKPGILSVTISAADHASERAAEDLAPAIWREVATAYELGDAALPAWRIVKEKRATFLASPDQLEKRPAVRTRWENLLLAGDYTRTGLPSTIEGAIRSGFVAAQHVSSESSHLSAPDRACDKAAADAAMPVSEKSQKRYIPRR